MSRVSTQGMSAKGKPQATTTPQTPPGQITFTDRLRINFRWLLDPIVAFLDRLGLQPNQLTLIGVLGAMISAFFAARGSYSLAGAILLLTGPVDALDGALARYQGQPQAYGAFVDSVTDRYSELALYAGLLWAAQAQGDTRFSLAIYFAAFGSVLVSYVRARAQSLGFDPKGGLFSRVERFLALGFGLLFNVPFAAVVLIAAGANFTALQRIWLVRKAAKSPQPK